MMAIYSIVATLQPVIVIYILHQESFIHLQFDTVEIYCGGGGLR